MPRIQDYIACSRSSLLAQWAEVSPVELTANAATVVQELLRALSPAEYFITDGIAVHRTATVEVGATLKPPLIIGGNGFVASGAYVRGGCWLAERCTVGPGVELKSSFVFAGTTFAHFNFVGDSVFGANVNVEAGAVVCNYRNERSGGQALAKFGALVGDGSRIGANAVLAPGTILPSGSVVGRLVLVDQEFPSGAAGV